MLENLKLCISVTILRACARSQFYSKLNIFKNWQLIFCLTNKTSHSLLCWSFDLAVMSVSVITDCSSSCCSPTISVCPSQVWPSFIRAIPGLSLCLNHTRTNTNIHTHSIAPLPPSCVSSPSPRFPCRGKRGLDGREERRQWGCDTTMAGSDFRSIQISGKHTNTAAPS